MTSERAVFAGGCFWGMQDLLRRIEGVLSTRVGYTGGTITNATYERHDGHAESIEILFDPALQQDPLRCLQGISRNRTIVASWSGSARDRTLTYAEPGHREYRRYTDVPAIIVHADVSAD